MASALRFRHSESLVSLRQRLSEAVVRSTKSPGMGNPISRIGENGHRHVHGLGHELQVDVVSVAYANVLIGQRGERRALEKDRVDARGRIRRSIRTVSAARRRLWVAICIASLDNAMSTYSGTSPTATAVVRARYTSSAIRCRFTCARNLSQSTSGKMCSPITALRWGEKAHAVPRQNFADAVGDQILPRR